MARQQYENSESSKGGTKYLVLGTAVAVALVYFGFIRPAQHHAALLQRQCDQLAIAVAKLDGRSDTAGRGLQLLDLLDQQNRKIASAETALREFVDLRRRLSDETESIVSAMESLDKLEEVRLRVDEHGRMLANTSKALQQMDQVANSSAVSLRQIDKVATSLRATHEVAQEAQGALRELDQLQTQLAGGLAKVTDTFPSLEPVVEDVQGLCQQLADSGEMVERATEASQRMIAIQGQLAHASETLPKAEQACNQLDALCLKLGKQADTVEIADRQLAALSRLKSELLDQARNLPEAAAVLAKVWDLRDGLLRSSGTLGEIQHLVVDMMLLEPAVKQAMLSLQPIVEITRLSRQVKATPKESTATSQENGQPATGGEANASAGTESPQASWSKMLEVAVAWCQQTRK